MDHERIIDRAMALSSCGAMVLDTENDIIYASGMVSDKLLPGQDLSNGYPLMKLNLPSEVLAQLSYTSKASFSSGKTRTVSAVVPASNQARLWAFTFTPSVGGSERPEALVVSIYDVGGAALDGQEQECGSLLPDGPKLPFHPGSLVTIDRSDLTVTFMNATALASIGAKKEDVIGKIVDEVLPRSSLDFLNEIKKAAKSGETIMRTDAVVLKGIGVRYYRWMITSSSNPEESKLTILFSDATDYTSDRFKEMSSGIYQEREMLRTIIDAIPVGLIIAENNGNIWLSNGIADRLWSSGGGGDLKNIYSLESYDEQDRKLDLHEWPLTRALRYGAITNQQVIKVHAPSGETRTVISSAAPLRSENGSFLGAISVFHDITEQKNVEDRVVKQSEALRRSNEELQQFAFAASHDLKEPLRMVINYVFLLQKHLAGKMDEEGREYMRFATEGATRMKEMIDQLLEYSRVERGDEMFRSVDMGAVIDSVIDDLQIRIKESGASITVGEMPVVTAIQTQMVQLIENLVSNAIKFRSTESQRVEISAKRAGEAWIFSVKDNGIGIDKKYENRIFTMFQRLHSREEYEGTGMGLALARRIVEHHGGRIWFDSETGRGSTFFFTIPAEHPAVSRSDPVEQVRNEVLSRWPPY